MCAPPKCSRGRALALVMCPDIADGPLSNYLFKALKLLFFSTFILRRMGEDKA